LVLCTTDVISHLTIYREIELLFRKISDCLNDQGKLILSFRDYTIEREDTERVIPFYSDDELIVLTFVEQKEEQINVTDILYEK